MKKLKSITGRELMLMSEQQLKNVYTSSTKWNDNRGNCTGISFVRVSSVGSHGNYIIEWHDEHGDPSILVENLDQEIKGRCNLDDSRYTHSLYVEK